MGAEFFLGYTINSRSLDGRGGYALHFFQVLSPDGTSAFELTFKVSYSTAGEAGEVPESLAEGQGMHLVNGLIHALDYRIGDSLDVDIDDLSTDDDGYSDESIKIRLLEITRRMMRSESLTAVVPALDVVGTALVLRVSKDRVAALLVELETLGLVESSAAMFGYSLADGAVRIGEQGIRYLDEIPAQTATVSAESAISGAEHPSGGRITAATSYSHDSEDHKLRVRTLSDRLRDMGVDVDLDQYHDAPEEGWPRWMTASIANSDFVVVICTPTYFDRVTAPQPDDSSEGRGARFEGMLITQELFEAGGRNTKFIPVVFESEDVASIPPWLAPFTFYDLSTRDGYTRLYRRLTDQPEVVAPPLGTLIEMPPIGVTEPDVEQNGAPSVVSDDIVPAEPLPTWHVDLLINWHQDGGPTRYLAKWTPGIGFAPVADDDIALDGLAGQPMPDDIPLDSAITVSYLPSGRLRFDFAAPITPVTARLHYGEDETQEPHARGGGAEHFYEFRLDLIDYQPR